MGTKKSLIEPLFTILGYDVTDPRECVPEHREDFGRNRSVKPVDYAFFRDGKPIFFVEAKQVDRKLANYNEQLGDYFAKGAPNAKLGILTSGVHWQFYTDLTNENVMDKRPFAEWQVVSDEAPPWDFLTVLQKSQYNPELMRTFAQTRHQQNLLIEELSRLLEPAPEFVKLAIANIETRNLTAKLVESWNPVVKAAIDEWSKHHRLSSVLSSGAVERLEGEQAAKNKPIETTQAELSGFEMIKQLLGPNRAVEYEDTPSLFKIHLPGKPFWAVCRLKNFGDRKPSVWVPLAEEQARTTMPSASVTPRGRLWSSIALANLKRCAMFCAQHGINDGRRTARVPALKSLARNDGEAPCSADGARVVSPYVTVVHRPRCPRRHGYDAWLPRAMIAAECHSGGSSPDYKRSRTSWRRKVTTFTASRLQPPVPSTTSRVPWPFLAATRRWFSPAETGPRTGAARRV